ncbi:MAG TPA: VWA domain-containing protein [Gaiellaceae bacterium]|nr:VWA domain-containing protein [Gaiellaceae bacterium]
MALELLTPPAGLVALGVLVPALALLRTRGVARRVRGALGLPEPRRRAYLVPAGALALAGGLLAGAAMQPVLSLEETRRVRTDAEAFVVLDVTRSMLASRTPGSARRIERAKETALAVFEALPTVRVGLASVTDRTLPHLFPTADGDVFRATLQKAVGIERPPPVATLSRRITSLESIAAVATQSFFSPQARRRALVVVTDGETLPGTRTRLAPLFRRPPGIQAVFVHVWGREERVFRRRTAEAGYRPDPGSREALERIADAVGGRVYEEDERAALVRHVRSLLGSGPTVVQGERRRDVPLAPPLAAAAFVPLVLLLWRRDR